MIFSTDTSPADSSTNGGATRTGEQQISRLVEWTNNLLLRMVRRRFNTQYTVQSPSLSAFRDAVSVHGGIDSDATLLVDFRTHVPLSDYDCYKPFTDRFDRQPCKIEDVENLFAPGLPDFLASSSSTSGKPPKLLARYRRAKVPLDSPFFDRNSKTPLAAVVYCGCTSAREIVDNSGLVVAKIPVFLASGRMVRKFFGWEFEDDESRMSVTMPYYAVPWAATTISYFPSFLTIHALFFLKHRDVDRFYVPFATLFVDLVRYIDEQWDMLVSSIRVGILPDLEGIDHVRKYIQEQLRADPKRAAELYKIGPPFSVVEGWAIRVWPNATELRTVCAGPWGMMLPKIRSILGPDIVISSPGYGTSESKIGSLHDMNKPDEFILPNDKVIEFLDISHGEALKNLRQAWEVEAGKQYEPIITTLNGLWRYKMGDIVTIIGFHPERHSPIFKILGRKSMNIYLPHAPIADFHLLEAIKTSNSEDTIIVQEFTVVLDDRTSPPTAGYFVELAKAPGPNTHLARKKLFDTFAAIDAEHQRAIEHGQIRLPTIRIVKPGTFLEYRFWRAKTLNINFGQIKVPMVLADPIVLAWIAERVTQEL